MKQMMSIVAVSIILSVITGCSYAKKDVIAAPCNTPAIVSYSANVAPVLQANCFSCHNNSFSLGGVSLEGFDKVKAVAQNGKLFNVINHTAGFSKMPKGGSKLDNCTIETIKKWIDNGTTNN